MSLDLAWHRLDTYSGSRIHRRLRGVWLTLDYICYLFWTTWYSVFEPLEILLQLRLLFYPLVTVCEAESADIITASDLPDIRANPKNIKLRDLEMKFILCIVIRREHIFVISRNGF